MFARFAAVVLGLLALAAQSLPAGAVLLCVHPDGVVAIEIFGEDCCGTALPYSDDSIRANDSECGGCTDTDLGTATGADFDRAGSRTLHGPTAFAATTVPRSPAVAVAPRSATAAPPLSSFAPTFARLAGATPLRI